MALTAQPVYAEELSTALEAPIAYIEVPKPEETIEGIISRVASEYDIASSTLYNLAYEESRLNPDPPGHNDGGRACGVVQIHAALWNFDCEELKRNPELGLRFAAKHIKEGTAWKYWSPCSCVKGARNLGLPLPKIATPRNLLPNAPPTVGGGVILKYGATYHVAIVRSIHEGYMTVADEPYMTIEEYNLIPCKRTTRTIPIWGKNTVGFWIP